MELFYFLIFYLKLESFIYKHLQSFYSRSSFGLVIIDAKMTKPPINKI